LNFQLLRWLRWGHATAASLLLAVVIVVIIVIIITMLCSIGHVVVGAAQKAQVCG